MKVFLMSTGAFAGMAAGFYLKENHFLKVNQERKAQLEAELQELRALRQKKEQQVQTLRHRTL